jgi:hypothetical protein
VSGGASSSEPGGPDAVRSALLAAVEEAVADGSHAMLVLHTWMAEGVRDALHDVLARCAAGAASGELWVARCEAVADWIAGHPAGFATGPVLDRTSWTDPSPSAS